jgi:outer membrane receptor protein involved in Fe transport
MPAVVHQDNERDQIDTFWESLPEFEQSNVVEQPNEDIFDLYTLALEKEFGGVTLSSITGLFERDQSQTGDFTFFVGGLVPPFAAQPSASNGFTDYENTSQELRLSSSGEGPFSWVFGGFYAYDVLESGQDVFTQGATSIFGVPPVNGIDDVVFTQRSHSTTKQQAAFGELGYDWTDRLATTVGLRYYEYDQTFRRQANGLFNGGSSGTDEDATADGTVSRVSASYELAEGHLAYLSATEGFRIGGSNSVVPSDLCSTDLTALGLTDAPSQYEPDEVWSYELGTKNMLLDSRVVLNAAVFYNDWTKLQQVVDLRSCGFSFTGNVGEAHSQGVEVEFRGRLTRDFDVAVGVAYTESLIDEGAPGVDAEPGDRVLHTPEWTVNLSANYERLLSSGRKLFARADYQWRDRQFGSFSPGVGEEKAYGVTNVSLGFIHDKWALRLFVDNLENKDPRFNPFDSFNLTASTLRPRTIGLKLTVQR